MPEVIQLHRATVRDDAYPACTSETSACSGGRLPCPTPDACVTRAEPADDIPANRPGGWPRLTSAGKFWLAYVAGLASALLLVHWGAQ
jgi:hypothetical protein